MGREPRRLKDVLGQGQFAVTVEYNPPKGTNINGLLDNAKQLLGRVHGVNVTDNTAAVVRAGSLPVCRLLYELGHDPVMQLTCRDRNRIAMQSDLMGAHMLGIRNVLCLTGDYPTPTGERLYQLSLRKRDIPSNGRTYELASGRAHVC